MWTWPFVLALVFAAAVGGWLQWTDEQDKEDERKTLITDVLTLENRITDLLQAEEQELKALARSLPAHIDNSTLLHTHTVGLGLRRLWVSVTVLGKDNRLLAHVPEQAPQPVNPAPGSSIDDSSLSAHLSTALPGGGHLIVRFAPASLLRQAVPWWLSRKYDVRLIDDYGQRIASTGEASAIEGRQSYRVTMEPQMLNAYLELSTRDVRKPWWRTLPMALMLVFLVLSAAASLTLRRQIREVASAENRWRTEAAWRRAIEDSLTVGLRGRDINGRLVHVNRRFCDLVGFPPEQLLGKLPPMPYWMPDSVEDSMQRHLRNMAGNAPREGYEARWMRSDGNIIDVMIFEAPLVNAQGEHQGWMGSIVDITARKQLEERERRQVETLGHQARLTMLGEVGSALAHQLNQPLTAVAGYNAGVLRSLERRGFTDSAVLDAIRRTSEQVEEAGRVVQRIRGFLTRHAPQREPSTVTAILQRAIKLVRRDLDRMGLEVRLQIAGQLPPVMADQVLIEQVLINLLRNAMDAMAGVESPALSVSVSLAGDRFVRMDVEDCGTGLGSHSLEDLARPFHTTKPQGMGMGLSICRSIVEAHFGAMEAGPSALGGARFSFTIPVADND
jgi:two-component system sensor histidine kinase DctS